MSILTPHGLLCNNILRSLPPRDWDALSEDLRPIRTPLGFVLYQAGGPIDWIYFPQTAVFSAVQLLHDGGVAEIAMIGPEGLAGWKLLLERASASHTACSMPGEALAIRTDAFLKHVAASSALRSASLAYAGRYVTMLSQLIACNRLHRAEQRCARWLLMTADRVSDDTFPLTQERLSTMLGAQRPTLTGVIASLRAAGCVAGGRGVIEILDRPQLTSIACECYEICASLFRSDGKIAASIPSAIAVF